MLFDDDQKELVRPPSLADGVHGIHRNHNRLARVGHEAARLAKSPCVAERSKKEGQGDAEAHEHQVSVFWKRKVAHAWRVAPEERTASIVKKSMLWSRGTGKPRSRADWVFTRMMLVELGEVLIGGFHP